MYNGLVLVQVFRSKKVSSKFLVYKFLVFSEILVYNFNLLFLTTQIETFKHSKSIDYPQEKQVRRVVSEDNAPLILLLCLLHP